MKDSFILPFSILRSEHISLVGGKNAAIGELMFHLSPKGIKVPEGFAIAVAAFDEFIERNGLQRKLKRLMRQLDLQSFSNLELVSEHCKRAILSAELPEELIQEVKRTTSAMGLLSSSCTVAVRSSATAEDSPDASFAGQHDSFLFIETLEALFQSIKACFASLYNSRAIKYRIDKGFENDAVRISVGIQRMIDTDLGGAGVCFTLDPDSGFQNIVHVNACWGLGESLVQGEVNPDEYVVFKKALTESGFPVIRRTLGDKATMKVRGENKIRQVQTPENQRDKFVLNNQLIQLLTRQVLWIEEHFGVPMDIEWARDGIDGELYILQARPETVVHDRSRMEITSYQMIEHGTEFSHGAAVGRQIRSGKVRIIDHLDELLTLQEGEILVSELTHPDWEPIMKKATAILTELGGRTSHAAIVARELDLLAVVGVPGIRHLVKTGEIITIDASDGQVGHIYRGKGVWKTSVEDISHLPTNKTGAVLSISNPENAFESSFYPNNGVGLLRSEFIISDNIGIHPMAACFPNTIKDQDVQNKIMEKS
jgi:pyruvate,water dikinase